MTDYEPTEADEHEMGIAFTCMEVERIADDLLQNPMAYKASRKTIMQAVMKLNKALVDTACQ